MSILQIDHSQLAMWMGDRLPLDKSHYLPKRDEEQFGEHERGTS